MKAPRKAEDAEGPGFSTLAPDLVIEAVESAIGVRCTSLCRPLASYINRVYEVELDDRSFLVAKFYRPGRWSRDALQDEVDFLRELHEAEVPVVPPLEGRDGAFLHRLGDTFFSVFPKRGGRPLDEPSGNEWAHLGRLIARMHAVGARRAPRDRIVLAPGRSGEEHLRYILESGLLPAALEGPYEATVRRLLDGVAPLFEGVETLRIHGDCHRANILHRPGEGYHLLDFDDMAVGPAVQDLWLLLPDRLVRARQEVDEFLEGYETFMTFPYETLRLIEPLRAMRYVHYAAWCARQKADGGFSRLAPDWGTSGYWRQEIADLEAQYQIIFEDPTRGA